MVTKRLILPCAFSCLLLASAAAAEDRSPAPDISAISQSQIEDLQQGTALGAAEMGRARPISLIGLELIKAAEGWRNTAYNDPSGYCTIGYGHLIALQSCEALDLQKLGFAGIMSLDVGGMLLSQDTTSARIAVSKLTQVDINEDQFGALVSFAFNVGKTNLQKSTLLKLVNLGAFDRIPKEFLRWSSSNGKILPGLLKRRSCEGELFMSALHLTTSKRVEMESCSVLGIAADIANPIDVTLGE